jgi:hypothetical protein
MTDTEQTPFDAFIDAAERAATAPPKQLKQNYKAAVDSLLGEQPDIGPAPLIRGVLRKLGVESSGADAMDDAELLQIVKAGARTLALHRQALKARSAAEAEEPQAQPATEEETDG